MTDRNDPPNKLPKSIPPLAPEIVEALKIEGDARINVNILIRQVAEKTKNSEEALHTSRPSSSCPKNMKIIDSIRSGPGLEPSSTRKRMILTKSRNA